MSEEYWDKVWALIDYTLEFARGARDRPEKAKFRSEGKMVWTTAMHRDADPGDYMEHVPKTVKKLVNTRAFFYVRIETEELLFFCMVNSLFSLMLEKEPSNHLHSIVIPKSYLGR